MIVGAEDSGRCSHNQLDGSGEIPEGCKARRTGRRANLNSRDISLALAQFRRSWRHRSARGAAALDDATNQWIIGSPFLKGYLTLYNL